MTTPALLVSVRNGDEAESALAGGADWIDLKEPAHGPLGAVALEAARDIISRVAGRARASAACGELRDWPRSAARRLPSLAGASHFKLGLAGCRDQNWATPWRAAQQEIAAQGKELVAVVYADHAAAQAPEPLEALGVAAQVGSHWLLVDTFDKEAGPLERHLRREELSALFDAARRMGLRTVAAGSLTQQSIASLPLAMVDVVAVRGAACQGGRHGTVCSAQVASLRRALEKTASS